MPKASRPAICNSRSTTSASRPAGRAGRVTNDTIRERGAPVWGVSAQGAARKRAFREKFGLPFTLLADEDHSAAEAYGSWVEKQNYGKTSWGTARTTFLIDPDGRVA